MDLPYSQQQHARRKTQSAANLPHLSLAPLTPRLPLRDVDFATTTTTTTMTDTIPATNHATVTRTPSYLQNRSAPATPRLLSRSPPRTAPRPSSTAASTMPSSRAHSRNGYHRSTRSSSSVPQVRGSAAARAAASLPKARSTTHLVAGRGGGTTATRRRRRSRAHSGGGGLFFSDDDDDDENDGSHSKGNNNDDDDADNWLFRAGVLVTSEARESKGQSWLTARASSTSLAGLREDGGATTEEEEDERAEQARRWLQQQQQQRQQRRPSSVVGLHGLKRGSGATSRVHSQTTSRATSRAASRVGSRVQLLTPLAHRSTASSAGNGNGNGAYFDYASYNNYDDHVDGDGVVDDGYSNSYGYEHDYEYYCDEEVDSVGGAGPDFVNLDEAREALAAAAMAGGAPLHPPLDTSQADADHVWRLVRREKAGGGVLGSSWLGSVLGWSSLFAVPESEDEGPKTEEEDDEDDDEAAVVVDGEHGDTAANDSHHAQRAGETSRDGSRRACGLQRRPSGASNT
ncbi:hypothetical protein SPI_01816 [Niveomyces insectorum RCEF 264]|uniref:Uncharacterized protein n=1 Tax=Niveomyces insectorum RCEF 264 TaxID=1081102 RepID=A0A167Z9D6_9HYPO|nr:hypothetical protein SPI_01816 [Niveomyces insectorum RCEF 264]